MLLEAIASLLWPLLTLGILLAFSRDIADALRRIKKVKIAGHEVELGAQLKELHDVASQVVSEVPDLAGFDGDPGEKPSSRSAGLEAHDSISKILATAAQSPTAALLLLAAEMEREGREVLASVGKWTEGRVVPFRRAIDRLNRHYGLPEHVLGSLRLFLETRNKLVHGGFAKDREILSALDSGVAIYRALQALPRERHRVYHEGVRVYSDAKCLHEITGVRGVILRSESSSGVRVQDRIFPSTKTHFQKGKLVSWEWNLESTWPEAWYRDPDSNDIKFAWSSAGEFVGRHFEDWQ